MPHPGRTTREHRFFCQALPPPAGDDVSDAPVALDRAESHHARHVLRLSAGDEVTLFNGRGTLAVCVIDRYEAGRAVCRLREVHHYPPETPTLTIASAVPKGPRAEAMVNQLSQLGVDRFVPLRCEHGVATPGPGKVEKFARSAVESAKQCGRSWLMRVDEPRTVEAIVNEPDHGLKLIAAPKGNTLPDLPKRLRDAGGVLVLIGPEGGWSEVELAAAARAGCLPWTIAPHILRIETAAATAAALVRYLTLPS